MSLTLFQQSILEAIQQGPIDQKELEEILRSSLAEALGVLSSQKLITRDQNKLWSAIETKHENESPQPQRPTTGPLPVGAKSYVEKSDGRHERIKTDAGWAYTGTVLPR